MGFLKWLRGGDPKGYKKLTVTFTAEESEAMEQNLAMHAKAAKDIAVSESGDDADLLVPPKVIETIKAQGLSYYAERLMDRIVLNEQLTEEQIQEIGDKAAKAQLKAYGLHNLPTYMFEAAQIFDLLGRTEDALTWFRLFLKEQERFAPDKIDEVFLNNLGKSDATEEISIARRRLAQEGCQS